MKSILRSYFDSQLTSCHRGSRIDGRIVASARVVNEDFVSRVAGGRLSIRFRDSNQLDLVAFELIPALSAEILGVDADLTITLGVSMLGRALAWTYQNLIGSPYFSAAGGRIYVKVGAVPQVAAWRHVWKNRLTTTLSSQSGLLIMQFTFEV